MPRKGWRKNADGVWEPPKEDPVGEVADDLKAERGQRRAEIASALQALAEKKAAEEAGEPERIWSTEGQANLLRTLGHLPDEPICEECWPDGWPPNSGDAECSHGHYHRDIEE